MGSYFSCWPEIIERFSLLPLELLWALADITFTPLSLLFSFQRSESDFSRKCLFHQFSHERRCYNWPKKAPGIYSLFFMIWSSGYHTIQRATLSSDSLSLLTALIMSKPFYTGSPSQCTITSFLSPPLSVHRTGPLPSCAITVNTTVYGTCFQVTPRQYMLR